MIALHGSGGATKGAGIVGAWITAHDEFNYFPDIISGVSVSAIMAVPFALGKHKEIRRVCENLSLNDIFNKKPVNSNGKITIWAIIRAIRGKSFGEQKAVIDILSDMVTESEFEAYKRSPSYPDVVIMAVDFIKGDRVFVNVKSLSYKLFLDYTLASSSMPAYTPPVKIGKRLLFDGGVRDHIISHYVNEKYPIKESFSVYSRPKDMSNLKHWKMKNESLDVVMRTIDIFNNEISKSDEDKENKIAIEKNITNRQVFLPSIMQTVYDTDHQRLRKLYQEGCRLTRNSFNLKLHSI